MTFVDTQHIDGAMILYCSHCKMQQKIFSDAYVYMKDDIYLFKENHRHQQEQDAVDLLKKSHTKHRVDYTIEYTRHSVHLSEKCNFCYNEFCTCEAKWVLNIDGTCSKCGNIYAYRTLSIHDIAPKVKDFLYE